MPISTTFRGKNYYLFSQMKKLRVERLGHLPKVTATKWRNLDSNSYYLASEAYAQLAVRAVSREK